MNHPDICCPVAGELRRAMMLACAAQAIKLGVWAAMLLLLHYLERQRFDAAAWLTAALLPLSIAYYTLKIRAHDRSHYAAFRLEEILRSRLAEKIAALPIGVVRQRGAGALGKILLDDVQALHSYVADAPPLKAEAYVTPPFLLALLCRVDPAWGLATLLFCAATFLTLRLRFAQGLMLRRAYAHALAQVNVAIVEYVQGMTTVRLFDNGASSFGRYRDALKAYDRIMQRWTDEYGRATLLVRSLCTPMPLMFFLLGGLLLFPHSLDAAQAFAFFLLAAGIVETVHPYMGLFQLLEKSRAAIERIGELEALPALPQSAAPQTPASNHIRYERVSFRYREAGAAALEEIMLDIPERSFTAIVGASGSGKTTLVSLLPRFWDVSAGRITLGGVDIRDMAQDDLLARCSIVFQDNFLFSCSIADNIRYGMEGIDDGAVIEAARKAEIHDFIMTLPQRYETLAGERGQLLSGGQRQRITIARAFLQDRPIVILDEPTSFSDARNEALLLAAFRRLRKNRTVIMIAHRLSSIVDADQIVYLEGGKILACGRHETLLHNAPAYRQLWREHAASRAWTARAAWEMHGKAERDAGGNTGAEPRGKMNGGRA